MSPEAELAYFSGFFDAVGFINLTESRGRVLVQVSIRHLDDHALVWAKNHFGGSVLIRHRKVARPVWQWCLSGKLAERCLQSMLPYLAVKRERVQVALEARSLLKRQGQKITSDDRAKRRELFARLATIEARSHASIINWTGVR